MNYSTKPKLAVLAISAALLSFSGSQAFAARDTGKTYYNLGHTKGNLQCTAETASFVYPIQSPYRGQISAGIISVKNAQQVDIRGYFKNPPTYPAGTNIETVAADLLKLINDGGDNFNNIMNSYLPTELRCDSILVTSKEGSFSLYSNPVPYIVLYKSPVLISLNSKIVN